MDTENHMQGHIDDLLTAIEGMFQQTFPIDYFQSIPGISKYTMQLKELQENLPKWKAADKEYWEKRES